MSFNRLSQQRQGSLDRIKSYINGLGEKQREIVKQVTTKIENKWQPGINNNLDFQSHTHSNPHPAANNFSNSQSRHQLPPPSVSPQIFRHNTNNTNDIINGFNQNTKFQLEPPPNYSNTTSQSSFPQAQQAVGSYPQRTSFLSKINRADGNQSKSPFTTSSNVYNLTQPIVERPLKNSLNPLNNNTSLTNPFNNSNNNRGDNNFLNNRTQTNLSTNQYSGNNNIQQGSAHKLRSMTNNLTYNINNTNNNFSTNQTANSTINLYNNQSQTYGTSQNQNNSQYNHNFSRQTSKPVQSNMSNQTRQQIGDSQKKFFPPQQPQQNSFMPSQTNQVIHHQQQQYVQFQPPQQQQQFTQNPPNNCQQQFSNIQQNDYANIHQFHHINNFIDINQVGLLQNQTVYNPDSESIKTIVNSFFLPYIEQLVQIKHQLRQQKQQKYQETKLFMTKEQYFSWDQFDKHEEFDISRFRVKNKKRVQNRLVVNVIKESQREKMRKFEDHKRFMKKLRDMEQQKFYAVPCYQKKNKARIQKYQRSVGSSKRWSQLQNVCVSQFPDIRKLEYCVDLRWHEDPAQIRTKIGKSVVQVSDQPSQRQIEEAIILDLSRKGYKISKSYVFCQDKFQLKTEKPNIIMKYLFGKKQKQLRDFEVQATIFEKKIDIEEQYQYSPKHFKGFLVKDLKIKNRYGSIQWKGFCNIQNVSFYQKIKIGQYLTFCSIPVLQKQALVQFYSLPEYNEREKEKQTQARLKKLTKGAQIVAFDIKSQTWKLKVDFSKNKWFIVSQVEEEKQVQQRNPTRTQQLDRQPAISSFLDQNMQTESD